MEELYVDSVAYGTLEGLAGKLEEKTLRVLNLHGMGDKKFFKIKSRERD